MSGNVSVTTGRRFRQAALAGTAVWLLAAPGAAWASCAVSQQGDTRNPVHGFANAGVGFVHGGAARLYFACAGQVGANDRHEGRAGLSFAF